jgi:outer membrane protein insertion porin family
MRRLAGAFALLLAVVVLSPASWAQSVEPIVREVQIRFVGPETVNRAVVRTNIRTEAGKPRSRDVIEQDVRNLIATGFFFDVRVLEEDVADGVRVVFQVQGKARIKEITIDGNKRFRTERLMREVELKTGDVLDERKAHDAAIKMTEVYQKGGFPDVKVTPESRVDQDTGKAIVTFKVEEGARVFIKRVRIEGAGAFSENRLRKLMKTRHKWWASWLTGTGVLKEEQFREDLDALREHYRNNGYLDMEIRGTRTERISGKYMIVHIEVFEGAQYKVGQLQIEGNKLFATTELDTRLRMRTDQIFTPDGLSKDVVALEDYYGARGYLDTTVRSVRTPNVATRRIDVRYNIREGELTYIQKVEIRGNTKTKDKVIRRELAVAPGNVYNSVLVDRSAERLRNLGYFSKVETTPEPTPIPNRRDLVIEVEEQRTGSVTFGAGFSSIDNFIGFVEITQGNFDLFNWPNFTGGGQKLRLRLQVGFERQDYVLSFVEPWFLDQRLSLGFDLFRRESSFLSSAFDESRTGGDIRIEKALNEFVRGSVQYGLQDINLSVDGTASQELQSQRGSNLRSSLEMALVYDARNSVFLATRGNRTEVTAELVGGPVGGDVSLYKLNAKTAFYFPFFDNHVLQIQGAVGVVEAFGASKGDGGTVTETNGVVVQVNDVPVFDRYFLGGANTLRGFTYRKVGPKDVFNEPVGGNTYANATIEYTLPVIERVRFAMFFDIGNVWRDAYEFDLGDLKSDAGIGIRLNLPIGPLRLDYGYPIQTDDATGRSGKFQFSVGYQF